MKALLNKLKRQAQATWVGYGLAGVFAAAIPITNTITLHESMQRMRFAAMDSRDTFYLSNLGSFEQASSVHAELAKMAVETMFSRNPDGFDNPERLERLFNPVTAKELNEAAGKDAQIFSSQKIHQKVEMGNVREIQVDQNTALVSVEAQILRTGVFNQRVVNDTRNLTIFLKLTLNDSMATNGRYPLVVTNIDQRVK